MEVVYKSVNGQFEAKFEGKGQDDIFEQVASFQEVFETPTVINGVDIPLSDVKFVVRQNTNEDKFYEQRYTGPNKDLWGFKREYHMKKTPKGAMYIHTFLKTDEDKSNYEDGGNGWRRWKGSSTPKPKPDTPVSQANKSEVPF